MSSLTFLADYLFMVADWPRRESHDCTQSLCTDTFLTFQDALVLTQGTLLLSKLVRVLQGLCIFVGRPGSSPGFSIALVSSRKRQYNFSIGFKIVAENKHSDQQNVKSNHFYCHITTAHVPW